MINFWRDKCFILLKIIKTNKIDKHTRNLCSMALLLKLIIVLAVCKKNAISGRIVFSSLSTINPNLHAHTHTHTHTQTHI